MGKKAVGIRKRAGVPSTYSPELGETICVRIAMGETLTGICRTPTENEMALGAKPRDPDLPHESTLRRWMVRFPDFHKAYHAARQLQADRVFDEIIDHSRAMMDSRLQQEGRIYRDREASVALRALQWVAARLKPQEYGERVGIDNATTIHIETTLDLGQGSEPVAGGKTTYTVEALPIETAAGRLERAKKEKPDGKAQTKE